MFLCRPAPFLPSHLQFLFKRNGWMQGRAVRAPMGNFRIECRAATRLRKKTYVYAGTQMVNLPTTYICLQV